MTNKMPEVGKRYRHKDSGFFYWAIPCKMEFEPDYKYRMVCESHPHLDMKFIDDFLCFFEELPDSQEKPEVQLNESILSEVEKAKEEFKKVNNKLMKAIVDLNDVARIKVNDMATTKLQEVIKDFTIWLADYHSTAQNLIDALENEENQEETKKESEEGKCLSYDESKYMAGNETKPTIKALQAYLATQPNILSKNQEETKKEEKPQSIWKPISELPGKGSDQVIIKVVNQNTKEITNIIGYYYDNFERFIPLNDEEMEFLKKGIKEWCYLTDFINDIEQTKLSHEERLRKLEGNDI